MTREVVAVTPDTTARDVARLLVAHGISAVPVIDASGASVGMVSEGDLIGRDDRARRDRRDWWLALLAEGESLSPDFLAALRTPDRRAKDVMAAPVVTVTETTDAAEIARLLADYRIKRVPVVRDGRVVGIVSRADLLRAVLPPSGAPAAHAGEGLFSRAVRSIHDRFVEGEHPHPSPHPAAPPRPEGFDAAAFRGLIADHEQHELDRAAHERAAKAAARRAAVKALIDTHVSDAAWRDLLHKAREAAERGEKEMLLLRFPATLCADGGRAINVPDPSWPATLRGEAAEIYLRWERELKPRGFRLSAHVLDFPGGLPGDVGLYLSWGW
jgi:CBS domain-containing protein